MSKKEEQMFNSKFKCWIRNIEIKVFYSFKFKINIDIFYI